MRSRAPTLLLVFLAVGCQDRSRSERPPRDTAAPRTARRAPAKPRRTRTVLLQVDGLSAQWLHRWLTERRFLPDQPPAPAAVVAAGGLARLARGARAPALVPVDPSLTAPNLATQLTGAYPARHGVVSNRFYRRGKRVNGFAEPMAVETLWQAAPRQGLRTVTWAVLGTRCDEPPHSLLRAVCFATSRWLGRPRPLLELQVPASGGVASLVLRAGPRARGRREVTVGLGRDGKRLVLKVPAGATLRGGGPSLAAGQSRGVLWSGGPPVAGVRAPRRLSRIHLRRWDPRSGLAQLYVSPTAINRAVPDGFGRALDAAGAIRPAMADEISFRAGRIDSRLFLRTGLAEADALVRVARLLGPGDRFDLALLYLGTLDSFGHQLLATAQRQELGPGEAKAFQAALERGLRDVDRRIAHLLDAFDLRRTRVLLVSDHGMIPIRQDVSVRAALRGLDPRIRTITAGSSGFVHLPDGVSPEVVAQRLRTLRVGGREVFTGGQVVTADGFARLGLPTHAADLFLQAAPGFSLSSRRTKTLTAWPFNQATHGYPAHRADMHGVFLAAGPGVRRSTLGRLHMTQVAAAVAAAVGMKPPRHARPGPPRLWSPARAQAGATGGR